MVEDIMDGKTTKSPVKEAKPAEPNCSSPCESLDLEIINEEDLKERTCLPQMTPKCERRRRKLPEIPVNKKPLSKLVQRSFTLAEELRDSNQSTPEKTVGSPKPNRFIHQVSDKLYLEIDTSGAQPKPCLRFYSRDVTVTNEDDYSPDDARFRMSLDVDSGNSTAHSPDGPKSVSPTANGTISHSSSSTLSSTPSGSRLQLQDATHRGLHKFVPRHPDEVEIEIGDPIYVQKEADDFWCEGVNLRSGLSGIFPSAYVTDVDYSEFDPDGQHLKKERYILDFLGSVEVSYHKGNHVLCQAVRKVVKASTSDVGVHGSHPCILEVTDQGLRMADRRQPVPNHVPTHDYFFNLKNVTFCGYHPTDHRYFGFITKHPLHQRFACHVFKAEHSTRDVAESVGRAFHRFYQKFIEMAYPVEDIYIE